MARAKSLRHTESAMHTNAPMITTSITVMNPGLVIAYSFARLDSMATTYSHALSA